MALFLVQHGKSLSKDKDPKKGLSEEGIAETERIAKAAKANSARASTPTTMGCQRRGTNWQGARTIDSAMAGSAG